MALRHSKLIPLHLLPKWTLGHDWVKEHMYFDVR
jgi:hypothetical protein